MANKFNVADSVKVAATIVAEESRYLPLVGVNSALSLDASKRGAVTLTVPGSLVARERSIADKTTEVIYDEITETSVSVTTGTHLYSGVSLSNADIDLNLTDFTSQVLTPQAQAIVSKVDGMILGAVEGVEPTATVTGAKEAIAAAAAELRKRKIRGGATVLIASDVYEALLTDETVMNSLFSGSVSALAEGRVPRLFGLDLVEAPELADGEVIAMVKGGVSLALRAPSAPAGQDTASVNHKGVPMSHVMGFDMRHAEHLSLLSSYAGVAVLPGFVQQMDGSFKRTDNMGVVRLSATIA